MIADQVVGHQAYAAGAEDAHGNPVDSWLPAVDAQVYGWGPRGASAEPGGTQLIVGLEVYAPATLSVGPLDRMVVEGVVYAVEGEADWSKGPLGRSVGQQVINLKRVEGGR